MTPTPKQKQRKQMSTSSSTATAQDLSFGSHNQAWTQQRDQHMTTRQHEDTQHQESEQRAFQRTDHTQSPPGFECFEHSFGATTQRYFAEEPSASQRAQQLQSQQRSSILEPQQLEQEKQRLEEAVKSSYNDQQVAKQQQLQQTSTMTHETAEQRNMARQNPAQSRSSGEPADQM
jgi:hypothetical protein